MPNHQSKIQNRGALWATKISISVPATAANLGAGFDVLGLALGLYNIFSIEPAETTRIEIKGYNDDLPTDDQNLFYLAFARLHELSGRAAPPLRVRMRLNIPPARGLGSSATAVVGGLLAANAMLGEPYGLEQLLVEAVRLERGGHADNVAPALLGGLIVNALDGGRVISLKLPFPEDLRAVVFIPETGMDTIQGRLLLPERYSRSDAVFNTSRVALFVAAITERRYDLLHVAMQDRMHQPYRAQIFTAFPRLIETALENGAHGACLSGGGSTVLALASQNADEIGMAMARKAESLGARGEARVLDIDREGGRVLTGAAE
jgi:homoserine kinase